MARKRSSARSKEGTLTTPAAEVDHPDPPRPPVFDLVGDDGRRIARSWSREACKELQARVKAATGETARIVPASPFSTAQAET